MPGVSLAGAEIANTPTSIQLTVTKQPNSLIQLEARQASLGEILKQIANKTGATIHYSVLPDAPVTATCAGASVGDIMDCLLAKQVGLVAHSLNKDKPAEFWLLGSSVGSCRSLTIEDNYRNVQPVLPDKDLAIRSGLENISPEKQQKSDALLEKLRQAKTPEEKLQALSDLASGGVIEDPNVRKALADASMSREALVRTQAVITSAALDKENASDILGNALHDTDSTVRTAALDMANDDVKVLEQALADSDSSIRGQAAAKLAEIKSRQDRLQQ